METRDPHEKLGGPLGKEPPPASPHSLGRNPSSAGGAPGPDVPSTLQALARQYRPTVNIEAAPPFAVPLPFVFSGLVALAVAGVRLWLVRDLVSRGLYSAPPVILTVHLVTLGFLTVTMTGLLYQWVPVVFDVPPVRSPWAWGQGGTFALGFTLFLVGWGRGSPHELQAGGALLAASLGAFVLLTADRLLRSHRTPDTVTAGVFLALAGLTATWVLGLMMAFGWPPGPLAVRFGLHVATAVVGWVATLVATVQLKLVPMFTMSRVTRRALAPFVLVALWAGLVAEWLRLFWPMGPAVPAALWTLAAMVALYQIAVLGRSGKSPTWDPVFMPVVMGWIVWLGAAVLSTVAPALAVGVALVGGVTFVLGYQSRIVPFIVALAVGRRLPGPSHKAFFMARAMGSSRGPIVTGLGGLLAALLLAVGLVGHSALAVGAAGLVLTAAVLAHVVFVMRKMMTGRHLPASSFGPPRPS
jgi:hypothetical protein